MLLASCIFGLIGSGLCALAGSLVGLCFGHAGTGSILGFAAWYLVGILKTAALVILVCWSCRDDLPEPKEPKSLKDRWDDIWIPCYLILCNVVAGPTPIFPPIM